MSNEIDLYKDLKTLDELIKKAKQGGDKLERVWIFWRKKLIKEIKSQYPDLALK